MKTIVRRSFASILFLVLITAGTAHGQSAQALIAETAKAMGGVAALRAIKNQVVESEGKQFDSSSTPRPLGPTRQISTFRSSLTRDLTQPRNGQVRAAPAIKEFIAGLDQLNLDVATIVGIHGDSAPIQAARAAAQGGTR